MDKQLVELITRLVTEKLAQQQTVKNETTKTPTIKLFQTQPPSSVNSELDERTMVVDAKKFEEVVDEKYSHVRTKTPARIGVGRTGPRPLTNTMLKFRFDHAAAVDTVYGQVNQELLNQLQLFTIGTKAETDKETYILRPDYGRKLTNESKKTLLEKCEKQAKVQVLVSNGLSANAINANLENVYLSLKQSLQSLGLKMGTPFYIEQGRVGLMDDIGELLQPDVIVYLKDS